MSEQRFCWRGWMRVGGLTGWLVLGAGVAMADVQVGALPPELDLDPFYEKHVDCGGIPIIASARVSDAALLRVHEILERTLTPMPEVWTNLVRAGARYIIIGQYELVTDIPEYANQRPKDYVNERVRGYGGIHTSCGEENVLSLYNDRYEDESILIHELAHAIHGHGLRRSDPTFQPRLEALYKAAMEKGLYRNDYASTNPSEYWAEAVQAFFDADRQLNWNHNEVNTREELYAYDPAVADLVKEAYRITDENDWRYKPLHRQPSVIPPPAVYDGFPADKYVWCRSFEILGTAAVADEVMLRADALVRNLFRYRHDVLKAMIDRNLRLLITPDGSAPEGLLPEHVFDAQRLIAAAETDPGAGPPNDLYLVMPARDFGPDPGGVPLVRNLGLATYLYTGLREPIPGFNDRGANRMQQYEIRLRRLDGEELDAKVRPLFAEAQEQDRWAGLAAAKDRFQYFACGVEAFFDGADLRLEDGTVVATREDLAARDAGLHALVREIFKHPDRVDWRATATAAR